MFFHLLKPIWKRKFKNILLSLEILLAFFVVFGLALMSMRYLQLYHLSIGFEYQDVWSVRTVSVAATDTKEDPQVTENFKRSLAALPEVEQLGYIRFTPFSNSTWTTHLYLPGNKFKYIGNVSEMTDETPKVLNMKLLAGHWFSAEDEGQAEQAIVINKKLADLMFPGKNPVGQIITDGEPGKKDAESYRVKGVMEDFRDKGDFMAPVPFAIMRHSALTSKRRLGAILLKVKPGTSRAFEEKLNRQLKMIRNDWGYRIASLSESRKSKLTEDSIPLMILAVIATFLLIMVGFGLFGVLWQNTSQRIPEIGLRRAIGAHSGSIYRQIMTEQMLLSSIAMLIGLVFLIQLPITGVLGEAANWTVFSAALLLSVLAIYAISLLCALYPAWRASGLSPTEALHYE